MMIRTQQCHEGTFELDALRNQSSVFSGKAMRHVHLLGQPWARHRVVACLLLAVVHTILQFSGVYCVSSPLPALRRVNGTAPLPGRVAEAPLNSSQYTSTAPNGVDVGASPTNPFVFWVDPPGSGAYIQKDTQWVSGCFREQRIRLAACVCPTRLNGSFSLFAALRSSPLSLLFSRTVRPHSGCSGPVLPNHYRGNGEHQLEQPRRHSLVGYVGELHVARAQGACLSPSLPCRVVEVPCCRGLHWPCNKFASPSGVFICPMSMPLYAHDSRP